DNAHCLINGIAEFHGNANRDAISQCNAEPVANCAVDQHAGTYGNRDRGFDFNRIEHDDVHPHRDRNANA
ncbi:MAG: hypothetical protein HY699_12675, partial [Deltaproteobacteria bacterium]|nr:hypothetical protein [Deltaproteobacteria bacterium]